MAQFCGVVLCLCHSCPYHHFSLIRREIERGGGDERETRERGRDQKGGGKGKKVRDREGSGEARGREKFSVWKTHLIRAYSQKDSNLMN